MLTDAVAHPVVALARQGHRTATTHGEFERASDSLLFKELKTYDLKTADFLEWIEEVHSSKFDEQFHQVMQLWANKLNECYGHAVNCEVWYGTFDKALRLAESSPFQFRGMTYQATSAISKADQDDFYNKVQLPTAPQSTGSFLDDVYERSVAKVREVWTSTWSRWVASQELGDVVADYDLNTGFNRDTNRSNDLWQ
jgi:hypothetical protein